MNDAVLVTGGAGFIGSHLIDQLLKIKRPVICLDNFDPFYPEKIKQNNISLFSGSDLFHFKQGDIRDKKFLDTIFQEYKISTVIHLAAKAGVRPSILNPAEYFDFNVNGTLNLLESMQRNNVVRLIFASSSSIYGNNKKIPYSENDNVDFPISHYAATKKAGELLTYTFHYLYQMSVLNLRFFTVYGPAQRPDLAIHKFFKNIYQNIPVEKFGDGNTSRDYTYVLDTVSGIVSALNYIENNSQVYEIINVGNNNPVTLNNLMSSIENITGMKFFVNHQPLQPGDVNNTCADITKAKQILNYEPLTSLEEGLMKFKEWYEVQ